MGDQRPPFRFRLPWLSAPAAPRARLTSVVPTESPPRSVDETPQVPSKKTETNGAQRPPFRPAGKAPVPPSTSPSVRSEPQPATAASSPIRSGTETRTAASQPASQSRTNATYPVPSPSRVVSQSRPLSVPPSPAPIASQPPPPLKPSVQPQSSPSRLTTPPPHQASPKASSPSQASGPKTELPFTAPQLSPQPTSVSAEQEQKPSLTRGMQEQETPSETKTISETIADSQIHSPDETQNTTRRPETFAGTALPFMPGSAKSPEVTKEEPKLLQEQRKEEQDNIPEMENTVTSSKTQIKEKPNNTVKDQKQVQRQHVYEKNKPSSTIHSGTLENNHQAHLHKDIREDISKLVHKLGTTHLNQTVNDTPITVITLSGENRGASMQMGAEYGHNEKSVHIHRGYKSNPDESIDVSNDTEGRSKPPMTTEDEATNAYINSNVQSINNSVVMDSSITEQSAGVQFNLTQNPAQPIVSNATIKSLDTQKAEYNITQAEKLTYQPRVRRQCLGGLMMESSDSDPDNPDKPRRHGCRYRCQDKTKS